VKVSTLWFSGSLVFLSLLPPLGRAATFTWSGGIPLSLNDNWSTPNNWATAVVPLSGFDTDLFFGAVSGSGRLNANQNVGNPFALQSLTFTNAAAGYSLFGN